MDHLSTLVRVQPQQSSLKPRRLPKRFLRREDLEEPESLLGRRRLLLPQQAQSDCWHSTRNVMVLLL